MHKKIVIIMFMAVLLLPLGSAFGYEAIFGKSELLKWDPDRAYNGYNLFNTEGDSVLVDMEGRVVNRWEAVDVPHGMYSFLMENGNLRTAGNPSYMPGRGGGYTLGAGGVQGRLMEYTWDGTRIWYMDVFDGIVDDGEGNLSIDIASQTYRMHHDYQRMYNSALGEWTYLILIWVVKDKQDGLNMGPEADDDGDFYASSDTAFTWSPCALIEVRPDYESGVGGDVIWYWTFADHMVTTDPNGTAATTEWTDAAGRTSMPPLVVSSTTGATDSIQANPQLLDVNGIHYTVPSVPRVDYQHCNSIDYDEATGYIAINAKASNEFFVIDHDGTFDATATANDWNSVGARARTSDGDFLYRYGNPANYYSGEPAGFYDEGDMEMYGTHDIQWILDYHWRAPIDEDDTWSDPPAAMALPGAGNFLMYDNGCYNPTVAGSKILEVNPYMQGDDTEATDYVWMATTANNPTGLERRDQVAWEYGGGRNGIYDFYSSYISGTTRMPNGNTIVCSGANSHFFEIEAGAEGDFNPNDIVWEYVVPQAREDAYDYAYYGSSGTFRFHRFHSTHPALAGRDLTRGDTLTGNEPYQIEDEPPVAEDLIPPPPPPAGWGAAGISVSSGDGGGGGADGGGGGGGGGY